MWLNKSLFKYLRSVEQQLSNGESIAGSEIMRFGVCSTISKSRLKMGSRNSDYCLKCLLCTKCNWTRNQPGLKSFYNQLKVCSTVHKNQASFIKKSSVFVSEGSSGPAGAAVKGPFHPWQNEPNAQFGESCWQKISKENIWTFIRSPQTHDMLRIQKFLHMCAEMQEQGRMATL